MTDEERAAKVAEVEAEFAKMLEAVAGPGMRQLALAHVETRELGASDGFMEAAELVAEEARRPELAELSAGSFAAHVVKKLTERGVAIAVGVGERVAREAAAEKVRT